MRLVGTSGVSNATIIADQLVLRAPGFPEALR